MSPEASNTRSVANDRQPPRQECAIFLIFYFFLNVKNVQLIILKRDR
jgi:hypothetical protein